MTPEEKAAVAHASARAVSEVSDTVERVSQVQRAKVRRSLKPIGPWGAAVMTMVDRGHATVFAAIRETTPVIGSIAAAIARHSSDPESPSVAQTSRGAKSVAGLSAAFGDSLHSSDDTRALTTEMTFRQGGHITAAPADDYICLFVHGLAETELDWCEEYAQVARAAGFSPAYVRYNSGLSINENGEKFRELLAGLHPTRLVLVAHSMGGLIARVAIENGQGQWREALTDLVTLGAPHNGAPLERVANTMINIAAQFDAAEPIADILHRRSQGIKDLGFGLFGASTSTTEAPPLLPVAEQGVALPDHVHHHAVVAWLGFNRTGFKATVLGDGLVPIGSASAPHCGPTVTQTHLNETHHNALNDHREVDMLLANILNRI